MNKLNKSIFLGLILVSNAYSVATSSITLNAAAASNNARNRMVEQKQQALHLVNSAKNGSISGVFICDAGQSRQRGYYGLEINTCKFWDSDRGYFYLPLSEVGKEYFPDKEVINVFYNSDEKKFEFYYR